MKKIKNKIIEISNKKYFISSFVLILNLLFFILSNILFEIRYETVDDFTIMKIISALDGNYSIYGVYIHPLICFFIILLYKTGININWYTVFLLTIQFISFTIIGIILIKNNKKLGTIFYLIILNLIYIQILITLNYTSVAAITMLAGIISLIYSEGNNKKYSICGFFLIIIGPMLRFQVCAIVLPFYILYNIYNLYVTKNFKKIKYIVYIVILLLVIYSSNIIIYNINSTYKDYSIFNKIRTYFFDYNVISYDENKEALEKCGWSDNDLKMLNEYSYADENFYTTQKLENLKNNLEINKDFYIVKIIFTLITWYNFFICNYIYIFIFIHLLLFTFLFSKIKKEQKITVLFGIFIFYILSIGLTYIKPVFRVIISLYSTVIIYSMYFLISSNSKIQNKIFKFIFCSLACVLLILNSIDVYKRFKPYSKDDFYITREVIEYTSSDKDKVYVYPNILRNISFSYSVYQKISDGTFSNLRNIGDWDIYDGQYYKFKERYNLENIITDLYKKDNLYLIDGIVAGADNKIYHDNLDTIINYIYEHYNIKVSYKVIKDFEPYDVRIYKLYEEKE